MPHTHTHTHTHRKNSLARLQVQDQHTKIIHIFYTNNEHEEIKIKNRTPFKIILKKMKY